MFRRRTLGRRAQWTWSRTCAGGSCCCVLCCKKPARLPCGPGTHLSWGSAERGWSCPRGCARLSSPCRNTGGSRTCCCTPADTKSPCPSGWCPCRPRRWRTPRSTRSPSSSGLSTEPRGTAPERSCRTSPGCQSRAAGPWCGWPSCCSRRRRAPCRPCWGPAWADKSLEEENEVVEFGHKLNGCILVECSGNLHFTKSPLLFGSAAREPSTASLPTKRKKYIYYYLTAHVFLMVMWNVAITVFQHGHLFLFCHWKWKKEIKCKVCLLFFVCVS